MLRVLSVVVLIQLVYWSTLIVLRQPAMGLIGEASYETVRDVVSMASILASLSVTTWMVSGERRISCWPFRRG